MGIIPGQLIIGPEPLRRRYGLLTAAAGPVDLTGHGRGGGLRYVPTTCGIARAYPLACYDGLIQPPEDGKRLDPENDLVQADPFGVVAGLECGAAGYTAQEFEAKARRRLENGEQGAAEEAFWTGLDPDGNALDIPHLAEDPDTVAVLGDNIETVVAALEDYAYRDQEYGYVAYIHAPVAVAAYAAEAGQVVDENLGGGVQLKRTPYGSIWIFGGGYPGTGADGAAPPAGGAYLHITGHVQVWRSPDVHVFPADQVMNRTTNQRLLVAEREYAIGFDCLNGRAVFDPLGSS